MKWSLLVAIVVSCLGVATWGHLDTLQHEASAAALALPRSPLREPFGLWPLNVPLDDRLVFDTVPETHIEGSDTVRSFYRGHYNSRGDWRTDWGVDIKANGGVFVERDGAKTLYRSMDLVPRGVREWFYRRYLTRCAADPNRVPLRWDGRNNTCGWLAM